MSGAGIGDEWNGKRVAAIGLGRSNLSVIRFCSRKGASVSVRDRKTRQELGAVWSALADLDVSARLGADYLTELEEYDAVFLSPGVPKDLPELQALPADTVFLSEIDLVFRYAKAPIIGITGSSGKSTTTALVGEMLRGAGFATFVGGNIGQPLLDDVEQIPAEARIVLELSSFQLEWLRASPHVAVVTNISENHLDVHKTMARYIAAKQQIYRYQTARDYGVFNARDAVTRSMADDCPGQPFLFGGADDSERGAYLSDGWLCCALEEKRPVAFCHRSEVGLPGEHNLDNVLAAAVAARISGAPWSSIRAAAQSFRGLPHRLQRIAAVDDVVFYDDSIATSPARTMAALEALEDPMVLIAGGYNKGLDLDELGSAIAQRVKALVLLGEAKDLIAEAVRAHAVSPLVIYTVPDMQAAVQRAFSLAEKGDLVLLSPACASYDMYGSFQERGDHFRALVQDLKEQEE